MELNRKEEDVMSNDSNDQSGRRIPTWQGSVTKNERTGRTETVTIELRRPAEAFAAVAWVVCAADKLGSTEEQRLLYEQVQNLDIFKGFGPLEFQYLLGATFNRVFRTLPNGELSIREQGVEGLIQAVNETLSPELRVEALEMAIGLARADGLCDEENALLEQLQHGLEIDERTAQGILGRQRLEGRATPQVLATDTPGAPARSGAAVGN